MWPRDDLEVNNPESVLQCDSLLAVEPRLPKSLVTSFILHCVGNKIRIENTSSDPVRVRQHAHLCDIRQVYVSSTDLVHMPTDDCTSSENIPRHVAPYSSQITVDPDGILPSKTVQAFKDVLTNNDLILGPISDGLQWTRCTLHIKPVLPPQRKGRLLQYLQSA
jgi:hypothetical protein